MEIYKPHVAAQWGWILDVKSIFDATANIISTIKAVSVQ